MSKSIIHCIDLVPSIEIRNHPPKETHFDFHLFLSIRPGILLWPGLNLLLLLTILNYNRQISIRFALSVLFQTIYIINVFVHETSMIRQSLDLSPPASFDALFTNLCWVPFTATLTSVGSIVHSKANRSFSLQFYIGKSQRPVPIYILVLAIVFFTAGFFLQYLAQRQRA